VWCTNHMVPPRAQAVHEITAALHACGPPIVLVIQKERTDGDWLWSRDIAGRSVGELHRGKSAIVVRVDTRAQRIALCVVQHGAQSLSMNVTNVKSILAKCQEALWRVTRRMSDVQWATEASDRPITVAIQVAIEAANSPYWTLHDSGFSVLSF
jgi:hypothetical protein